MGPDLLLYILLFQPTNVWFTPCSSFKISLYNCAELCCKARLPLVPLFLCTQQVPTSDQTADMGGRGGNCRIYDKENCHWLTQDQKVDCNRCGLCGSPSVSISNCGDTRRFCKMYNKYNCHLLASEQKLHCKWSCGLCETVLDRPNLFVSAPPEQSLKKNAQYVDKFPQMEKCPAWASEGFCRPGLWIYENYHCC